MNTLLSSNILSRRKDLVDEITSIPNMYHEKKHDALIKWVGILEAFEQVKEKYDTIVNIGCGLDSLPIYFKQYSNNCYAIDVCQINPEYENHGIICRQMDFFLGMTWRKRR